MNFIFYLCFACIFSYGFSFFVIDSFYAKKFWLPLIDKIAKKIKIKFLQDLLYEGIYCYGCVGFWGGIIFFLLICKIDNFLPFYCEILLFAFVGSGFSLIVNNSITYWLFIKQNFEREEKNGI